MIIEGRNYYNEPRGIEIDKASSAYGWVYSRHPDGQWVTLRIATRDEIKLAEEIAAAATS